MKENRAENNISLLLLTPLPPPIGGIATWTNNFIESIKKYNVNFNIVDTKKSDSNSNQLTRTVRIFKQLKLLLKNNNYNVAHINSSCSQLGIIRDYYCAKKIKKHKCKLVLHFHCNAEDQINNNKISLFYLKKIMKLADCILILNESTKEYLKNLTKTDLMILPNFINENLLCDYNKVINKNIKRILFVGRVVKEKGIEEIIDVANKLTSIHFDIAGPNIDYKNTENITFLGEKNQKEIFNLLKETDVFVLPTYSEGFSIAILEAMAHKVPIITTNVGANQDMLENKGGVIINKQSSLELLNAINAIDDSKLREEMSNWNYEKVKNNYTSKIVIQKLYELYLNLCK